MGDAVPEGVTFGSQGTSGDSTNTNTTGAPEGVTFGNPPEGVTFGKPPATTDPNSPNQGTYGFGDSLGKSAQDLISMDKGSMSNDIPLTSYGAATRRGVNQVVNGTVDAAKGVVAPIQDAITHAPETMAEHGAAAVGGPVGLAIFRQLKGLGHSAKDATQIVGAIHDINHSKDPLGTYAKVAEDTAGQGAGQALAGLAAEGATRLPEGATAAYKNTKGLFSTSHLQEPLQNGIRGILKDTAQDAGVAGPKPTSEYKYDASGGGGNQHHTVTTTAADGTKIGELSAQDTKPGVATVRSNQVYDAANRGRGYGKAQVNKLLSESSKNGTKFVNSDISTSPDAQRVWRQLEKDQPEAVSHEDFKPKDAEGKETKDPATPTKTRWTVDLSKYKAPAETELNPSAEHPSIRKSAEGVADRIMAESKGDYQMLDQESGGRIQRFRDKLEANRRKLMNLTDSEEDRNTEASILKNQKETEDSMHDEFDALRAKGVDPKILDRADANFKKSQALYDLDNDIKKSTSGAHPGESHPDLLKESPETVNAKTLHKRINARYDSGRLQEALGEENANKMFDHTLEHSGAHDKIMRNRATAMKVGKGLAYGSLATGLAGGIAHQVLH